MAVQRPEAAGADTGGQTTTQGNYFCPHTASLLVRMLSLQTEPPSRPTLVGHCESSSHFLIPKSFGLCLSVPVLLAAFFLFLSVCRRSCYPPAIVGVRTDVFLMCTLIVISDIVGADHEFYLVGGELPTFEWPQSPTLMDWELYLYALTYLRWPGQSSSTVASHQVT